MCYNQGKLEPILAKAMALREWLCWARSLSHTATSCYHLLFSFSSHATSHCHKLLSCCNLIINDNKGRRSQHQWDLSHCSIPSVSRSMLAMLLTMTKEKDCVKNLWILLALLSNSGINPWFYIIKLLKPFNPVNHFLRGLFIHVQLRTLVYNYAN